MIRRLATTLVLLAAVTLSSCSGGNKDAPNSKPGAPDPSWVSSISQHSNGAISRHSPVRVLFTDDVVAENRVGGDAATNIVITPAVKVHASFTGRREIVIRPETEFAANTEYRVQVLAKGLAGMPPDTKPFEFVVKTLEVNFDVKNHGLDVEYGHEELMTLRGSIDTADSEKREKLEKILTAEIDGKPAAINWLGGERQYQFTIANIPRKKQEQHLTLRWDGAPLGLAVKGEGVTRIPALDEFAVTQADAVQVNDQRQIQLRFSDAVDPRQDLKGLVRLSSGEFTTSIQNNQLTLYVNENVVGKVTVTLEPQIRSRAGNELTGSTSFELEFTNSKPQVRFVGNGVILPDATTLSVPFEAVSARAVQVTAMQVFEPNIPQFLQVNSLSGHSELGRVGRVLWRKTLPLTAQVPGKWTRYNLDVSELMRKHPGGLFQISLSLSPKDAQYECAGQDNDVEQPEPASADDADGFYSEENQSNWNYYEDGYDGDVVWNERGDPCKPAYYRYGENIRAQRNLLASNIGLIAKRAAKGKLLVVATALDSARPLPGVNINAISYQNQLIASGRTDSAGTLQLEVRAQPFSLIADHEGRKGYLKVSQGVALPTSHFDVGGETVVNGLKGYLYGDRGVWRPGDSIYLTFALQDRNQTLPAGHPVTLELRNPRGQLVQTLTNTTPVGQFYTFELKTTPDSPTGDWNAVALVGGATFSKTLKVETVMPNRLKIDLAFDEKGTGKVLASSPLRAALSAQWLSGATAADLRAAVEVRLSPGATRFTQFKDYVFDDPARSFNGAPITVFDAKLDAEGRGKIEQNLNLPRDVPGMLNATFITRVFERGGAFSINRETRTVAAFDRYLGVKMPKGDAQRDMLHTDVKHIVEVASVDLEGKPVAVPQVKVSLYKVQWRWWWEQNGESLAQYAQSQSNSVIKQETIATSNGRGQWSFEIKYPEWGRYLLRVCDVDGGHCTGRVFYVDWPAWVGEQREQSGPAANILALTADKQEYKVGETAVVQLPEATQGRALLTIESGSAIIEHRWLEMATAGKEKSGAQRVSIPITAAMAPNVYVAVTLVQPHAGKTNDRPIRLYGVIPLTVSDPKTRIAPVVTAAAEWAPNSKASITVSENAGRAMNYTLAVVDEGLLGLTNFKTPNLHAEFYRREALGVLTWDLFDEVAGAYGGELDRLLALGGSDAAANTNPDEAKSRFPPVVKFLGPFTLKAGEKRAHSFELPQYVGAVRIMVVAGDGSAYGSAEKSVFVRQALMILPTLPRVIGPDEQFTLPVSVFTSDAGIKTVNLEVQTDARFSTTTAKASLTFTRPEEKLGFLSLRSGSRLGQGKIKVIATSGRHRAESEVWLEVRSPNAAASRFQRQVVAPGASWNTELKGFGLEGSQSALLEVSALPPINLDGRLQYLINYPHGCLEQTTSAAFPQLYLSALIKLDQNQRLQTENNIRAGIARLRSFQHTGGGFSYWPGVWDQDPELSWRNDWGTTYAGHFMLQAEKLGYSLPGDMKSAWLRYQKSAAQRWSPGDVRVSGEYRASRAEGARFAQAYRLYTLALAGAPEMGAMNRLRETASMSLAEKWLLASAYKHAGKPEVAQTLVDGRVQAFVSADSNPYTFGSLMRDRAIVLQGLTLLGRSAEADKLMEDLAAQLVSGDWYSTQSLAFALVAVAETVGTRPFTGFSYDYAAGKSKAITVQGISPVSTVKLPAPAVSGSPLTLTNTSDRKLYVTAAVRAIASSGEEDASEKGLTIDIRYTDADGDPVDIARLPQGMDLIAQVTVRNTSRRALDNLALTQMFPGGWEIRNDRLENADTAGERSTEATVRTRFWWVPTEWRDRQRRAAEYTDIRDDRVLRYFSLNQDESIFFETRLNAAYLGRFYLPGGAIEAMYDAHMHARQRGQWVEVVPSQK